MVRNLSWAAQGNTQWPRFIIFHQFLVICIMQTQNHGCRGKCPQKIG